MAFLDTPQTDAGNATYLTNGHDLDLSFEKSFLPPLKKRDNLVSQLPNMRRLDSKTPRSRAPFADRGNPPAGPVRGEFTPLLKSVSKKNLSRNGVQNGVPQTPAFLKADYKGNNTPALPALTSSMVYEDHTGSSVEQVDEGTPVPQAVSSSAHSTPLAALPKRDGDDVLADQGNAMTLREQENIINKIEKENFGLKLKIFYMEENLRKAAPGYSEVALKENTELKVDRITLQKELSRTRKTLTQAERDLEAYRLHLLEAQEKARQKHVNGELLKELESLRDDSKLKESELVELRNKLSNTEKEKEGNAQLRESVEDLEADLREKDRMLEDKDDEIERLHEQAQQALTEVDELRGELDSARDETERLRELQRVYRDEGQKLEDTQAKLRDGLKRAQEFEDEAKYSKAKLERAQLGREEALNELRQTQEELDELREEISNKSLSAKGLNRQLEEKASRLQNDLSHLREKHADLQEKLDTRERGAKKLEEMIHEAEEDFEIREQRIRDENEILRHDYDSAIRKRESVTFQLQSTTQELQNRAEEKDLLQSRHDALTSESQSLRKELSKVQAKAQDLEERFEKEKRHALNNDNNLREQAQEEVDTLSHTVHQLRQAIENQKSEFSTDRDKWESQQRDLRSQKEKAEERASGLQRTVNKLQESEGTLSSRETKLQDALESEKQRHRSEESVLTHQLEDLKSDIKEKRQNLENLRKELSSTKNELRACSANLETSEGKVQALEDEIEVLQSGFEEDAERAKEDLSATKEQAKTLQRQLNAANQELRDKLASLNTGDDANAELSILRGDLSGARKTETDLLQRDISRKESIRGLKLQIADLERQLYESELLKITADSPKSSISGSARKSEIEKLRQQIAETHQQMKEIRSKFKEAERDAKLKIAARDQDLRAKIESYEQQREQLEQELTDCRLQQKEQSAQTTVSERTIARLRGRIEALEKDLHAARLVKSGDRTIAEERKDLHDMLKDAKLEAEDLQIQISDRETRIQSSLSKEKDLRTQLRRVREERTLATQKSTALSDELDNLQHRYESAIDDFATSQQNWEKERKAMVSRVRFPNTSISSVHAGGDSTELKLLGIEMQEKEKRHQGELKGLAKQIQWLRARCKREEGFRFGLAYEKKFLMMQIEMFEACNTADLHILEEIGVTPKKEKKQKRPRLKAVGLMVLAGVRLRRMEREWAGQRKLHANLVKKAEQVRRQSRKSK